MPLLVAVMGPTASGKTALAEHLSEFLDGQLINADAFQVYRGMDVGTAKPEQKGRYLLLDIKDPDEGYGVGEFVQRAHPILASLYQSGRSAVVVGGTGLYLRALFEEYETMHGPPDPALREALNLRKERSGLADLVEELRSRAPGTASRIDLKNPVRVIRALERLDQPKASAVRLPPFRKLKLAIVPDSEVLEARIEQRTFDMVQNGWVQEVMNLRDAGYGIGDPGFRAIGYRQIWESLEGRIELESATAATIAETKRYAKRQRTWLRTEPNLVPLGDPDPIRQAVDRARNALI